MTRSRRTASLFLISLAVLFLGAALSSLSRWRIPFGPLGQLSGHALQLRIEIGDHDADPFQYRAHPAGARLFSRAGPLGPLVEVGILPLLAAHLVLLSAALSLRWARRPAAGLCPNCRYPLGGLRVGTPTCPECGGALTVAS
jgi:hypothetical protein